MKKTLIASAALAAAVLMTPTLISEAAAKSIHSVSTARSPYCDMAKNQKNPVSWNAAYGCLDRSRIYARAPETHAVNRAGNPYCDLAKNQKNPVSWNAAYGCLSR